LRTEVSRGAAPACLLSAFFALAAAERRQNGRAPVAGGHGMDHAAMRGPSSIEKAFIMRIKKMLASVLLATPLFAQASVIVGGSTLLDAGALAQLESWLGRGSLTLTNIFSKGAGDNSATFHAGVDGRGPTFSVMSASSDQGASWNTVGGYDPLSWDTGGPHSSLDPNDWSAFIFNLSDGVIRRQNGPSQTINAIERGPSFGVFHVADDLTVDTSLSSVYSSGWGYGDTILHSPGPGPDFERSIVDGSANPVAALGALEVFSISFAPTRIPEPGTLPLMGVGALAWFLRRRAAA
jgi:hypothetical protein